MLWDKPRVSGGFATGPGTTAGDLFDATFQSGLYADNLDARDRAVGEAYDVRNDAIFKATGVRLENPWRQLDVGSAEFGEDQPDFFGEWQQRANDLANNRPEFRDIIRPDRSPLDDARDKQRAVLATARDTVERYDGALPAWMVQLGGGLKASAFDKVNLATLFVGPTGRVGTSAAAVAWNGIKAGAANAAVEATFQPSVAAWRKEAGLDLTASEIALNVGSAFGLGFGLDAGVRSAYRGVQRFSGRAPVLDGDGKVMGWRTSGDALEDAARAAAPDSDLARAAAGDPAALRKLADETGAIEDPAVRGALDELDNALPEAEALREAGDIDRLLQALRHADDPNAHAPPTRGDATPDARGISMADDAPAPPGRRFDMEGKPVTFADVDPLKVETDAAVFQFKAGGDAAGATERLRGVETWDPIAAGRAVIYQRRDGTMIIADGHQRLTLARRLADQKPQLQAFVFREADGWTPGDVRALAAKKNLQEGSGTVVDAAAIIRERPDIIDKSVPLGSEAMRQARALARLSDAAFDMVVGGVIQPNYAALLGDLVPDKGRHAGMIDELVAADPANVREARFVINELIYAPVQVEEQLTLLGSWRVERSLMKERVGVLDKALNSLKSDQRLFRTLDREAGRIEAAGNTLDKDLNARRAAEAAELAAVIEQLAATRGPVGEWLNDAARAVSSGMPKSRAADAFARRVAETLERDGLRGLMREPESLRGAGIDDPGGPDAVAQVASLERSLGREIEIARAPEKAAEQDQVLFSLGREIEQVWGPKFDILMGEQYRIAEAGFDFATMYDILSAKLTKASGIEPEMRAAMTAKLRELYHDMGPEWRKLAGIDDRPEFDNAPRLPLFSMREKMPIGHTQRALEQWEEIGRALRDTLTMLPPDVRLRVEDKIIVRGGGDDTTRYAVQGYWSPTDRIVWVALSDGDPVRAARHEVVHALRSSGLLTDQEFDAMYRFAESLGLREAYQIDKKYRQPYGKAYGHLGDAHVEALLREEVIANMFADYSLNGRRFGSEDGGGFIDQIIDVIVQFLARLRTSLGGLGFRDVRDIFEAIETGELARRAVRDVVLPGGGSVRGVPLYSIKAFHGSPHDFDRFSMDKIGTGEGAQAYGHGLYFAENEGVAKSYRDALSDYSSVAQWRGDSPPTPEQQSILNMLSGADARTGIPMTTESLRYELARTARQASQYSSEAGDAMDRRAQDFWGKLEELKRIEHLIEVKPPAGHMYEVRINADPEDFLDWDKPLSQQSEKVRAALASESMDDAVRGMYQVGEYPSGGYYIKTPGGSLGGYKTKANALTDMQKMQANASVSRAFVDDNGAAVLAGWNANKGASANALREAGIPGIRYLDQGSRAVGEGSSNYVVFDDALIEIVAKNGQPLPSLRAALDDVDRIGDLKDLAEACKL